MNSERVEALKRLGFNSLEAEVYVFLLANEPQTAYKIGKSLGKPTANVYKAIETLARRGAVLVEEGKNRLCAAVPFEEFTQILQQQFSRDVGQANHLLQDLQGEIRDERIYQIQSVALVIQRCRAMLASAQQIVVLDAFPKMLEQLVDDVQHTVDRGVKVLLQAYAPVEITGAEMVIVQIGAAVLDHWQSQQLNVIVDGREHLIALVDGDLKKVHQAIWSRSLYLSCMLHAGFSHEHTVHRLMAAKDDPQALVRILNKPKFFLNTQVPGKEDLFRRYMKPKDKALKT